MLFFAIGPAIGKLFSAVGSKIGDTILGKFVEGILFGAKQDEVIFKDCPSPYRPVQNDVFEAISSNVVDKLKAKCLPISNFLPVRLFKRICQAMEKNQYVKAISFLSNYISDQDELTDREDQCLNSLKQIMLVLAGIICENSLHPAKEFFSWLCNSKK